MKPKIDESSIAIALKRTAAPSDGIADARVRQSFARRLREVASRPDVVPIQFNGNRLEVRRGGTILGSALKNGLRLMHVCGARTLCSTCRVRVDAGAENLTPMSVGERFSLRWHLSVSPRTRLACQARVEGPVEIESVFPLCGELPNG
jgi:ferredoxin